MLLLIRPRRRARVEHLTHALFKFFKRKRAIVARRGEAEAVFNKHILARFVSRVHAANLRDGDMRLVYDGEKLFVTALEVAEEGEGRLTRLPPVEVARIILNTACVAELTDERKVMKGTALQALGFKRLLFTLKLGELFFQFQFNIFNCAIALLFTRDEVLGRKYKNIFWF